MTNDFNDLAGELSHGTSKTAEISRFKVVQESRATRNGDSGVDSYRQAVVCESCQVMEGSEMDLSEMNARRKADREAIAAVAHCLEAGLAHAAEGTAFRATVDA